MAKIVGFENGAFLSEAFAKEAFDKCYSDSDYDCVITPFKHGFAYRAVAKSKAIRQAVITYQSSVKIESDLYNLNPPKAPVKAVEPLKEVSLEDVLLYTLQALVEPVEEEIEAPVAYEEEESDIEINDTDNNHHCTYCGDSVSGLQRDHVVSMSWRGGSRHYGRGHTVPSCPECNNILGDKALHSITERAAYLVDGIAKRNKASLNVQSFTDEELEELEPSFRRDVIYAMQDKARVKRRINYASLVANGFYSFEKMKGLLKQGKEI